MAEYIANASQAINVGSNVIFTDTIIEPCNCVRHRTGSGIFTLRGGHRYAIHFNGNLTGATAGTEVDLAFTLGGEEVQGTRMASTPAVDNDLNNVTAAYVVNVPCGCCYTLSIENVGTTANALSNANLIIVKEN